MIAFMTSNPIEDKVIFLHYILQHFELEKSQSESSTQQIKNKQKMLHNRHPV